MTKFKITIIASISGVVAAAVVESYTFPVVSYPQHTLTDGRYGTLLRWSWC